MRVFVAGATGAVGRPLVQRLIAAGHHVTGTTRTDAKFDQLWNLGAHPVLVDGLDAGAVGEAVARAEPDAIVHQMTALAGTSSLRRFDRTFARTNRLRTTGTDNLLAASTGPSPGPTGCARPARTTCSPPPGPPACAASSPRATPAGRTHAPAAR